MHTEIEEFNVGEFPTSERRIESKLSRHASDEEELPRYQAIGGTYCVIPKERLKAAGWKVTRMSRPALQRSPDMWLDMDTGEFITKTEARKRGIHLPILKSTSDKLIDLLIRIGDCPPKERPFVAYLLKMRNHRAGLVVNLDTVIDLWIKSEYPNLRSNHKSRKKEALKAIIDKRRLMVNDTTMASDLQVLNPKLRKRQVLEEAAKAYTVLRVRGKNGRGL